MKKEEQAFLDHLKRERSIRQLDYGIVCRWMFWPEIECGAYTAFDLRLIADELDRLNSEAEKIREEQSG